MNSGAQLRAGVQLMLQESGMELGSNVFASAWDGLESFSVDGPILVLAPHRHTDTFRCEGRMLCTMCTALLRTCGAKHHCLCEASLANTGLSAHICLKHC